MCSFTGPQLHCKLKCPRKTTKHIVSSFKKFSEIKFYEMRRDEWESNWRKSVNDPSRTHYYTAVMIIVGMVIIRMVISELEW